jgi:hypothetical protein
MSSDEPMILLTTQEIAQYRSQLADFQDALFALDAIEDCEGDLEDAAISLAIHVGQQPDRNDWLDGLAKRCRVALCQEEVKENLLKGKLAEAIEHLMQEKICPAALVTPVVIYTIKQGINDFCEPLNFKL